MDQLMKSVGMVSSLAKSLTLMGVKEQVTEEPETSSFQYRARPTLGLQGLVNSTKISRKEIQLLYRGFKQGCPSGTVGLEQFKEIYSLFFPHGYKSNADTGQYAIYVFNSFDRDKNGRINFEEFVLGLSVLSRGSIEEKLRWIFDLYDVDQDGLLTTDDIEQVMRSVYSMMGSPTNPPIEEDTIADHVSYIFNKMDENGDGTITVEEFIETCSRDESICQSLGLFDTILIPTT
jgi:Ca2+-binding EF-hand superfamily protein